MKIRNILMKIAKETKSTKLNASQIANWILRKEALGDLLSSINEDDFMEIPLRKKFQKKKSINRLRNFNVFLGVAKELAKKGYTNESKEIYKSVLDRTPDDTSTLNDFGATILNEIVSVYNEKKKIDKEKLLLAKN